MSISSTTRKAGPYDGNDVTTAFPFSFKVFSADDVVVVLTDPAGIETTLTGNGTDYSVALNADQDTAPGGTVNKVSALATGYLLTITSSVPNLQPLDLTNQGGFYPKVINAALDRLTILAQQNAEQISRSVKAPISSSVTPDSLIVQLTQDAATAAAAASSASASKTAAAASESAAATSASDAATSASNAATSASNAANSETAAAGSATSAANSAAAAATSDSNAATSASNAATSASNAANSETAAAGSATSAANSAAAAATSFDDFDDRYLGSKDANPTTDNDGNALLVGALYWNSVAGQMRVWDGAAWQAAYAPSAVVYGLFYKADPTTVAFTKTDAGTASIKAGTKVDVAGTVVTFVAATAITMPTLTAGTDYAIWVKDDATIQATTNFSSAPDAGNWRKIGGFHYAPGGNAAAVAGGDTTPAINAYSFWDLKFRPACPDPRGMTLVADSFWSDIYLLGVDHLTNGTSKYNVSIADGSAPPKIPTKFGGDGSTAYSTLNWWEANEVLQSWGKRSPTYDEFAALAYGTTEATSSGGTDVPTTGVSGTGATNAWNIFTSRWGVIQATGCMWIWGGEFGGGAADVIWTANTGGRGSTYQMENAVRFGDDWDSVTEAGSRCSAWNASPTASGNYIGARGVCDHLTLD
ncbi:MAG: phage major tropism determinant [Pseudomonadaceae bacterium]